MFFDVFIEKNYQKVFEVIGLVSIDTQIILDCLKVQLYILPKPLF